MSYLAWALILLLVGLALVVMETFIPSAGLLAILAAVSLLAAVVVAFLSGPGTGLAFTVGIAVLLPVVVVMAIRIWPHTPLGRRLLLRAPQPQDVIPEELPSERFKVLVGTVARAKTKMLPAGAIVIDGRTIDAVSQGMPIEQGQLVRIVEARGNRVVVVPYEEDDVPIEEDRVPTSQDHLPTGDSGLPADRDNRAANDRPAGDAAGPPPEGPGLSELDEGSLS